MTYQLSITSIENLIAKTEATIAQLIEDQMQLDDNVTQAERAFEEAKQEMLLAQSIYEDERMKLMKHKAQLRTEQETLKTLVAMRNDTNINSVTRVMRTTSNLDKQPKQKHREKIYWGLEIKKILEEAKRAMSFEEIISTLDARGLIKHHYDRGYLHKKINRAAFADDIILSKVHFKLIMHKLMLK